MNPPEQNNLAPLNSQFSEITSQDLITIVDCCFSAIHKDGDNYSTNDFTNIASIVSKIKQELEYRKNLKIKFNLDLSKVEDDDEILDANAGS